MESSSPPPVDPVATSNRRALLILLGIAAVVAVVAAVVLLGGESKEEQALSTVCAARADINSRIDSLLETDIDDFKLEDFKEDVSKIMDDLKAIRESQPELSQDRGAQISQANSQFGAALSSITGELLKSSSLSDAANTLQGASADLATAYKAALQPVDCTGVDLND